MSALNDKFILLIYEIAIGLLPQNTECKNLPSAIQFYHTKIDARIQTSCIEYYFLLAPLLSKYFMGYN